MAKESSIVKTIVSYAFSSSLFLSPPLPPLPPSLRDVSNLTGLAILQKIEQENLVPFRYPAKY
jgi:hypothetical protein